MPLFGRVTSSLRGLLQRQLDAQMRIESRREHQRVVERIYRIALDAAHRGGAGRSTTMFHQAFGVRDSSSTGLTTSLMATSRLAR